MDRPKTSKQNEDQNFEGIKGRPSSRRGIRTAQREPTAQGARTERPISRAASSINSQDGGWRPPSGIARIQGTASRLISTASQSQQKGLSRAISPPRLDNQVNVTDRLITQQGLSSRAKSTATALRGPGRRQVLDKRYFEGLLQLKIRELTNEIASIRKDTENSNKEREAFLIYDKQNKELAKELTELQGTLADYNLVMDRLHTGTELADIEAEYQSLKATNDAEHVKLEQLFAERTQRQQQIRQVEEDIQKERHVAEKLVETMPPEMRQKYAELSDTNLKLQEVINRMQEELDTITKDKALFQQQLYNNSLKQEAVKLELKLLELEEKRNNLVAEENDNNPNNLQQKYLNQVKEDNTEIATMERSMNQLNEELQNYEKQLEQVDQDLEECQSDRHKKYLELRKREETIESFLSTYEETKNLELENLQELKSVIVKTMFKMSKFLLTMPPTENEYELINKELTLIDSGDSKGQQSLLIQYKQKQLYLEKLQGLESKLKVEIDNLQEKMEKARQELSVYTNLDHLKDQAENQRKELLQKKQQFLETQDALKDELKNVQQEYEKLQKELDENETHKQLQALERKLAVIEQDNTELKEYITEKKNEMNYESIKDQTTEFIRKYNEELKEKYKSPLPEI
ncbi:intraflagellar transport protein 74 homolog [Planococcus citri]|uniref:intraflagellar transport protein 74 homolog n=1 Tax=Planococcus citri TaxID=170843 RepID=UPI0031F8129E